MRGDTANYSFRVSGTDAGKRFGMTNPEGTVEPLPATVVSSLEGIAIPARRWCVPGWVPDGQVTMLSGAGGNGKSLLAQQLMTAAALGREWLGIPVERRKVFGLFCEDEEDELQRRQEAINRLYDVGFGDLEEQMSWYSYVGGDATLATYSRDEGQLSTMFWHRLERSALDSGAQLVVIDSLHDVFGGNEIDRVQARGFIRQLQELARGIDGAVILNCHPSRAGISEGHGGSGSTAWVNAARSHLYLEREKEDNADGDGRVLTRKKANYAAINEQIRLAWCDGVFEGAYEATGAVKGMEQRNAETAFLEALATLSKRGQKASPNRNVATYAPKMMTASKMSQVKGFKIRDLEAAMTRLFDADRITVLEDGPPSKRRTYLAAKGGEE